MNLIQAICLRAKPHGYDREIEFLEGGFASIGWPDLEPLTGATPESIQKQDSGVSLHDCTQILTFANAKEGCKILVPGIANKNVVHILEVTGGYVYRDESYDNGNPHSLPVQKICTVDKTCLPEILQRAISASRRAVSNFSKYRELIDKVIEGDSDDNENPYVENAIEIIRRSLESEDEKIRLDAAIFVLQNPEKII